MEDHPTMEAESAMVLDGLAVGVDYLEGIIVFLLSASHPYAQWVAPTSDLRPTRVAEAMRHSYLASEEAVRAVDGDLQVRTDHPSLMIESPGHLMMVHRVRTFGVAICFTREAPLGFARMAARQIVSTLEQDLPYPREEVPAPVKTHTPSQAPRPVSVVPSVSARPSPIEVIPKPTTPGLVVSPPALDFEEPAPDTTQPRSSIGDRVRAVVSHVEAIAPDPHIVRLRLALRTGLGLDALSTPDVLSNDALLLIETAAEDILGLDRGKLTEVARS